MSSLEKMIELQEENELVQKIDQISEEIMSRKGHMYIRDKFFPPLIDAIGGLRAVEIGVDKADFSVHMLSKSKIAKYYCIDTWQDDFGSPCRPGFFDKDGKNRLMDAQNNLKPFLENDRAEMWQTTGMEASVGFQNNTLDFVYIDGDHSLEGIYTDIKAWLPKVKIGGIIAGHDYKNGMNSGINDYFGNQLPYNVKTVVDDYCRRYGYALRSIGGVVKSWYFVKHKETTDQVQAYLLESPEAK